MRVNDNYKEINVEAQQKTQIQYCNFIKDY